MRTTVYTIFILFAACLAGYGQTAEMRPVPGSKPFVVANGGFENLDSPASMDRLGKLSDKDKKARLDSFIGLISAKNKTVEYVILLNGKVPGNVGPNMAFIYRYLTVDKKISPLRISFVVAADSPYEAELWLIPNKNIWVPTCMDCAIIPAEDKAKLKEFFDVK